ALDESVVHRASPPAGPARAHGAGRTLAVPGGGAPAGVLCVLLLGQASWRLGVGGGKLGGGKLGGGKRSHRRPREVRAVAVAGFLAVPGRAAGGLVGGKLAVGGLPRLGLMPAGPAADPAERGARRVVGDGGCREGDRGQVRRTLLDRTLLDRTLLDRTGLGRGGLDRTGL